MPRPSPTSRALRLAAYLRAVAELPGIDELPPPWVPCLASLAGTHECGWPHCRCDEIPTADPR